LVFNRFYSGLYRAAVFDLESRLEAGSAEWADEQQEVAAQLAEKEAALAALQAQHGAHTDALVQDCARKVNRPPELVIFSFLLLVVQWGSVKERKASSFLLFWTLRADL
jgi:hypothetical protein